MPKVFYKQRWLHAKSTSKKRKSTLDYTKVSTVPISRDIVKKVKRQSLSWGKRCASRIPAKGLVFRMCNELLKLNNKKTNNPIYRLGSGFK